MNQTPDVIGRYAQLSFIKDACLARGLRTPPPVIAEMQRIETMARARLSPSQLQSALNHVEHAKMRLQSDAAASARERTEAEARGTADRVARQLTSGMLGQNDGLTRKQVAELAAGKTPNVGKKRKSQDERDAEFRQRTRALDPAGKGWSEAEWERRMDTLADATPTQFAQLTKHYRADSEQLRKAANQWKNDRIEHGLLKRRQAHDQLVGAEPMPAIVTDRDRRRAAVVESYMQHSADQVEHEISKDGDSETLFDMQHTMSRESMDEKDGDGQLTRRAQLARAYDEQEQSGSPEE